MLRLEANAESSWVKISKTHGKRKIFFLHTFLRADVMVVTLDAFNL